MQGYDLFMLVVLVAATVFGAYKGLAWQVASLAAIFVSYLVAHQLRGPVSEMIDAQPPWNIFLAMAIVYVATSLAIWLAFRFISSFIDRLKLKEFDRQIGALFGFAKGVLLCVIVTLFALTLLGEEQRRQVIGSRSGYYIAVLLDRAQPVMPPELQHVLRPYIDDFDGRIEAGRTPWRLSGEPPAAHVAAPLADDPGQGGAWWTFGAAPDPQPSQPNAPYSGPYTPQYPAAPSGYEGYYHQQGYAPQPPAYAPQPSYPPGYFPSGEPWPVEPNPPQFQPQYPPTYQPPPTGQPYYPPPGY